MRIRGVAVLATAALVVPVLVLIWLRLRVEERLETLTAPSPPIEFEVEQVLDFGSVPVRVRTSWTRSPGIAAPAWRGTVSAVLVEPGDHIGDGTPVVVVDGVTRFAFELATPFYRDLGRGDSGEDVLSLQLILAGTGHYDGEIDGSYGGGTARAVSDWAATLGVVDADGAFERSWVIWLPYADYEVAESTLVAGFPAPDAGMPFVRGPDELTSVTLERQGDGDLHIVGDWRLVLDTGIYTVTDGELPAALLEDLSLARSLSSGETGGTEVNEFPGEIRRLEPRSLLQLPAAAVAASGDGELCVYTRVGDDYRALRIEVIGGEAGRVNVAGSLEPGTTILANPTDILEEASCR